MDLIKSRNLRREWVKVVICLEKFLFLTSSVDAIRYNSWRGVGGGNGGGGGGGSTNTLSLAFYRIQFD